MSILGFNFGGSKKKYNEQTDQNRYENFDENQDEQFDESGMPVIPQEWMDFFNGLRGQFGEGGMTDDQRIGMNYLMGELGGPDIGADAASLITGGVNPALQSIAGQYGALNGGRSQKFGDIGMGYGTEAADLIRSGVNPALQGIAMRMAGSADRDYSLGAAGPGVDAKSGAAFSDAYRNPFESQVVGSTMAALDQERAKIANRNKAAAAAGGALGSGGLAIQQAQTDSDYLDNVARTIGDLRSRGFETAQQFGQSDASRKLAGDTTNVGIGLQRDLANQSGRIQSNRDTMDALRNTSSLVQQQGDNATRMADYGLNLGQYGLASDANARANLGGMADLVQGQGNNALSVAGLGFDNSRNKQGIASNIFNSGSAGIDQLLNYLRTGQSTFGTRNTGARKSTGSRTGTSTGTTNTRGSGSGTSFGFSLGS